jgi:hypothetical protein
MNLATSLHESVSLQRTGDFFIPLLGAYASGTKREVSQKQSAIILTGRPLPAL